ncbi:MAG: phosphopantetheine-binding protein [Betaproteobacteria bacterium]
MTSTIDMANEITLHLAELVVATLNLEQSADAIDPGTPLFGDTGLGLDSIDILEISLAVSKRYGFQLRSDDENNQRIFSSLNALAEHIALHRTK